VFNTETRKWPVEALVENLPGNSAVWPRFVFAERQNTNDRAAQQREA
jgi:hypothetical protein